MNNRLGNRAGLLLIAAVFVIALGLNNLLFEGVRLDLTQNRLYTLTDGSREILSEIDEPINLYFFWSDKATADLPYLRAYATRVRELLDEMSAASDGSLLVSVIDPIPFSEEEDRAALYGLQGVNLAQATDPVYMGIAGTNAVGDEEIIPFLDPSNEAFLEYNLARLIHALANPERPVMGILSSLPISGGIPDPMTGAAAPPWAIMSDLRESFDLRELNAATLDSIDADVDILMLAHAKNLPDNALFAIDQYVLNGGRALLFVDPFAEIDIPPPNPANPTAALTADRSSDLNRLLNAWGVNIDRSRIVLDNDWALSVNTGGPRPVRHMAMIGVPADGLDNEDIATSGLDSINLAYTGHITRADDAAVELTPLITSSALASTTSAAGIAFMQDPLQLLDTFEPTGERYTLAARITGPVSTAFPDGLPVPPGAETEDTDEPAQLTESREPVNIVLVADADLLSDRLWVQTQNFFGTALKTAFASNGDFIGNAAENLAGSGALIGVRGKASFSRPFTRVDDLRRQAESEYRQTEQQLQQELAATEERLAALQQNSDDTSSLILSMEKRGELERFRDERLRIRKELRQVQRNLDQSIEDLGTRLKIINIGLMPLIISIGSLLLWLAGRRRSAR